MRLYKPLDVVDHERLTDRCGLIGDPNVFFASKPENELVRRHFDLSLSEKRLALRNSVRLKLLALRALARWWSAGLGPDF